MDRPTYFQVSGIEGDGLAYGPSLPLPAPGPNRRLWLIIGGAAVLLLVALGIGLVIARQGVAHKNQEWRFPITLPGRAVLPQSGIEAVIAPNDARSLNAAVPFFSGALSPARPFRFIGSPEDRVRAEQCLAAAQLYEAGYSASDQKAVAQVILNRVRHPAFPHNICSVVFEGSDRSTGCQFTFTCDGALARRYPQAAWDKARGLAALMIDGMVDPRVGWATHYHTDWVYPYWSPSLDKLSAIGTHLFFRWRGYWGTAPAFIAPYIGGEPIISKLAGEAALNGIAASQTADAAMLAGDDVIAARRPLVDIALPAGVSSAAMNGNLLRLVHPDGGSYGVLIRQGASADELVGVALRLCYGQSFCKVMGWGSVADVPTGFPIPPSSMRAVQFTYVRDPEAPRTTTHFDCSRFPRTKPDQCVGVAVSGAATPLIKG